jgi:hypothetical protein
MPLMFYFFTRHILDAVHTRPRSGKHLHRPNGATTEFSEQQTPNWIDPKPFPQLNCAIDQLWSPGHGGREHRGKTAVFPAMGGGLVQLKGSGSITDAFERLNKGAGDGN